MSDFLTCLAFPSTSLRRARVLTGLTAAVKRQNNEPSDRIKLKTFQPFAVKKKKKKKNNRAKTIVQKVNRKEKNIKVFQATVFHFEIIKISCVLPRGKSGTLVRG